MAKAMYLSKKYTNGQQKEKTGEFSAVSAGKTARPARKMGLRLLLGGVVLAILVVLALPLMVGGSVPATSRSALGAVPTAASTPLNVAEYNTPQEAMQALGAVPAMPLQLPAGYELTASRVVDGKVLELEFRQGKSKLVFRAATGSEDLSGVDQEACTYTATEEADGILRGYAGVSEKKLNAAVWVSGGFSYAVVSESGVDAAAMKEMAQSVR